MTTVFSGERENDEPRRFLIATAISRYPKHPQWDRTDLVQAREDVIDLFTSQLGYRHQTALGLDPTRSQLTDQLRAFCKSSDRREDDLVAVYVSGHGEVLDDGGDHVLYTSDTDPEDTAYTSLPTVELARAMLRDTPVRRLLLILDTCYSGQGGNEMTAAALHRINSQWRNATGAGLVIISSAQSHQQARAGTFPQLFTNAVRSWATAGHGPQTLSVSTLVEHMNNNPERPGHQRINLTLVGLSGEPPAFLANPRRNSSLTGVDLAIQHAAEFDAQAERRTIELTTRLLMRAMGSSDPRLQNWWFSGRRRVLGDLAAWLGDPGADDAICRVVTAGPGSGKTAVLGLIAVLSHPEHRLTVPTRALELSEHLLPEASSVDVVIYAQSLTDADVLAGLAAAAGLRVRTVGEFLEALEQQDRPRPFTALIDALDEAATPDALCSKLVRPLITHGRDRIRLLLGTRPYLLDRLGLAPGTTAYRTQVIDLDDPHYADRRALRIYTIRNLLDAQPDSPYRGKRNALRAVAEAVTEAAGTSFLVARITASTLAAADAVITDPSDPQWRASLPRHADAAMRNDLTRRLGDDAQRATDLLRPLAFALGQGLPWEDIWAPLASEISGRRYTNADLMWLRRSAGAYVVEATEAERSAYRLYHQALVEHLRDSIDATQVHAAYTTVLTRAVPYGVDGTRDWSRAHPYILNYLTFHATTAGQLDDLLDITGYLVHTIPRSLTPHLHHTHSQTARTTATIYRSALPLLLKANPDQRRQILARGAAKIGAASLLERLNQESPSGTWTTRWAVGGSIAQALRDTLTGHTGTVYAVACTVAHGTPIAITSGDDNTVRVWDLTTASQIGEPLTGHTGRVLAVACIAVHGAPVAITGGADSTVRVWDLTTGQQTCEPLTGHTGTVDTVACTTVHGTPIAITGGADFTVRVWDLTTGRQIGEPLTGHTGPVTAVACTVLHGTPVAVTGGRDAMRVWNLSSGSPTGEALAACSGTVTAVACTIVDGTPIAITSGDDNTVRVWDLTTASQIGEPLTGHTGTVDTVACTAVHGTPIAITSGDDDNTVRVWDLISGQQTCEPLTGHTGPVFGVACTVVGDTPVAVTGGADGLVRVWNLTIGSQTGETLAARSGTVTAVTCTIVDGTPIAVASNWDGSVRVWDLTTGIQTGELTGHTRAVTAVACTVVDGTPVAITSSADGTVRMWDLTTGIQTGELTGHTRAVTAVACTVVDGTPVAITSSADGTVRMWDLTTTSQTGELTGHTGHVTAVAFAVEGMPVAVTGNGDGLVRVWDLTTRGQIGDPLTAHTGRVDAVACTVVDGTPVAITGGADGLVRVWDLTTGRQTSEPLTGHTDRVFAVACTVLDGTPVAVTASRDGTVRWWDLVTRKSRVHTFNALAYGMCVAFTADHSLVVTTGSEVALYECPTARARENY
ncbi:caspase family protein [Streptomyces phaeochromogenes]|uniref:caspase family protein n=1 Tax=Streptomyces phaeochromogenes TaxID=1923 RepID=UPI00386C1707|nr:caspase family protein [Streptomyces phaeochromogenes]